MLWRARVPTLLSGLLLVLSACSGNAPVALTGPPTGAPALTASGGPGAQSAAASSVPGPSGPVASAPSVSASLAPAPTPALPVAGLDYRGEWSGRYLAGTIKYCSSARQPYWALDVVASNGDRAFVAYDIPPGGTDPVPAVIVTPFITSYSKLLPGTGQFVPGNPAHFILVNGEGRWNITLSQETVCGPRPSP